MFSGWVVPMHTASYKGVSFDVISIEDSAERALVEHLYPYVNGGDLEDMGLNPKTVQVQAIFFGEGYYTDLVKLLAVLQKQGAGVLVHPILGRMPNMMCSSHRVRHDAENINHCTLDLTFKEATEAEPIFVFKSAIVSKIDGLIVQLEDLFNTGADFWNAVMSSISAGANWKARLLGIWGGLYASFEAVRSLFSLDKKKYSVSSYASSKHYATQASGAINQLKEMIDLGIDSASSRTALTFSARLRNVTEAVANIKAIPQAVSEDETLNRSKTVKLTASDVSELSMMLDLICLAKLTEYATLLIEDEQETLISYELEELNYVVRNEVLVLINKIRQAQQADGVVSENAKTTAIYESAEALIEQLRQTAHDFTALVVSVINKKPPLVVKTCPLNGTIHQVAHRFYGDYTRADELLLLNPAIRLPNFIKEGDLLNAYAQ
ncbi:DNA circularization protein [Conservatibacter flavescens]|uniref:DNA circulation N-terminal domain-containing protein n=1 Tax=Conservatibacter flavescens TaxID=28161 RepID=A0A2M8S4Z5_9PAST|nr:DNA circularization N-terminal domain-containing protein [Conservatibacter flavescens]PJG86220.1 hypothetical protein CVP05_03345 [Conservatibacter flavescens]